MQTTIRSRVLRNALIAATICCAGTALAGPTPAEKCQAGMSKAAGQYSACIAKAGTLTDPVKEGAALTKCHDKLQDAWTKLEAAAVDKGSSCLSTTPPDEFATFLDACVDGVAAAAGGNHLPTDVTTCNDDLGTCNGDLNTCDDDLDTCETDLGTCESGAACGNGTVDSGEDCEAGNLAGETCASQGFAGGTLACAAGCHFDTSGCYATRFVDNGDGTVTDHQTGLTWEQKTGGCPAGYQASGFYDSDIPSGGEFALTFDSVGTSWTGSIIDYSTSFPNGSCSGTTSGSTFTGTCSTGSETVSVSGNVYCGGGGMDYSWTRGSSSATGSGSLYGNDDHSFNFIYTWTSSDNRLNGGVTVDFLDRLNGVQTGLCFTANCDWRLPSIQELWTIRDATAPGCAGHTAACIDQSIFGPTAQDTYWTGQTEAGQPPVAAAVDFASMVAITDRYKFDSRPARAVRKGLY